MPVSKQIVQLAQLAVRTGRIARGDALIPSIQKKQADLVVLSSLCGANRKKKILDKSRFYHIPVVILDAGAFDTISPYIQAALAVCDEGFASKIEELARSAEESSAVSLIESSEDSPQV